MVVLNRWLWSRGKTKCEGGFCVGDLTTVKENIRHAKAAGTNAHVIIQ